MTELTIKTNNQPRQPMSGLTIELFVGDKQAAKIRKQFDYLSDTEFEDESFITYKGYTYAMSDFMRIERDSTGDLAQSGWHGYSSDSFFSGVLVKLCDDGYVIMGRFYS